MPGQLTLALAQLNPTVGDVAGNIAKLREARKQAAADHADLLMSTELFVCGYPPEDLVLKPSFQNMVRRAVEELAETTVDGGPAILIGAPWRESDKLYNAALLLDGGKIVAKIFKTDLPNYGPFDEKRLFTAAPLPQPVSFRGRKLGILICEDMWTPAAAANLKKAGAEILLVPNGSPYESDKLIDRRGLAAQRVKETGLPLVYVNQVGGQDELVFDGTSFILDADGKCCLQMAAWREDIVLCVVTAAPGGHLVPAKGEIKQAPEDEAAIYEALMLGLRDYVNKNGFNGVVLGLSGGIDSALAAVLAADAIGGEKLWSVMMPSPYTSDESLNDAASVARALHCRFESIHITTAMEAFGKTLGGLFEGSPSDTAEENIQSRCRGILLMAISNKFGPMVISTGNKSEMSVGFTTLYGDLCGGFAVLKDLYKMQVFKVARWRNCHKPASALGPDSAIIPERIFTKPPSAELRPDQKDEDSLPPYDQLDAILECLIEKDLGIQDIVAQGYDAATIKRVWAMLDRAEYKRRQAPPGVKITRRHHGIDRRYPITNKYKES